MAGVLPYLTACRARLFRTRAPVPCAPAPAARPAPEPPGWCGYAPEAPEMPEVPASADTPSPSAPSTDGPTPAVPSTDGPAPGALSADGPCRDDETAAEVEALRTAHPGWRVWSSGRTWYACGPWLEARLVHAPTPERLSALIALRMEGGR
ncbi:hypothetical protein [Sphaerisporangium sp. NPDC051011]|uniref:hypothetical protein n=1 Tax=Sphaerisporangium sp. NPDC051011 TaxID=3155792 RepID=UPI0033EA4225